MHDRGSIAEDYLLILAFGTTHFDKFTSGAGDHTNSTRLERMPLDLIFIFLQTVQVKRKSVFLVALAPVLLNLVTAGLEYRPQFPTPRATPRLRARYLEPRLKELGAFFLF